MIEDLTPVELASQHIRGATDDEEPQCRICRESIHVISGNEPTAFCSSCAWKALDVLADEMVRLDDRSDLLNIQRRAAVTEQALLKGAEEIARLRMLLTFISEHAMTVSQTALGPLSEIQRTMLREIKQAARGTAPDWFLEDWNERTKDEE
jgi:hypothetical protein